MATSTAMIPPQDIATSTRNSTKGRMQEILDEIFEEIKKQATFRSSISTSWCIWETIQESAELPVRSRRRRVRLGSRNLTGTRSRCVRVPPGCQGHVGHGCTGKPLGRREAPPGPRLCHLRRQRSDQREADRWQGVPLAWVEADSGSRSERSSATHLAHGRSSTSAARARMRTTTSWTGQLRRVWYPALRTAPAVRSYLPGC